MRNLDKGKKEFLRKEYHNGNIALYLGAGVSIENSIPSWEKLVLAMYFSTISEQRLGGWRPFSNYLYAIAEWYLKNGSEPLEITARKLRKFYMRENINSSFLDTLYNTLYGGLLSQVAGLERINHKFICDKNPTMMALRKLCASNSPSVNCIVSYNYDSLLEIALDDFPHQTIFHSDQRLNGSLPIYHVHGYVTLDKSITGSGFK